MTHTFRHPKHYKEMRAERRKLQAASEGSSEDLRSSKPQAYQINYDDFCKGDEEEPQASSSKPQASSPKHKASSSKPQATSSVIRDPRNN